MSALWRKMGANASEMPSMDSMEEEEEEGPFPEAAAALERSKVKL